MTFIVSKNGVRNTPSTRVEMGKAKISVGGTLVNEGNMSLYETDLTVNKNFIQKGTFKVNDPQKFADAVLEITKSCRNTTEFGLRVLNLLRSF